VQGSCVIGGWQMTVLLPPESDVTTTQSHKAHGASNREHSTADNLAVAFPRMQVSMWVSFALLPFPLLCVDRS